MAKLLGKADSTLVQAATKAAMAGVPANLSRVHERMARSHRRTMESLGRSFKEITSAAVKAGGELIKTAKQNKKNNRVDYENNTDYQTKLSNLEKEIPGPKIGGVGQTKFPDLSDVSLEKSKPALTEKKEFGEVTKEQMTQVYSILNSSGNEEIVTTKTIPEQLEDIRKQKLSIGLLGDKRKEFTKEERKLKREELNMLRDNLRASALEFKTFENTATALIESDNFNSKATGEVKQNFLRALLNKGEPIGGDGPFAGSRALMAFDKKGKMSFIYVDKYGDPILDRNSKPLSVQQSGVDELLVPKSAAREVYKVNVKAQIQTGANNLPYNRAFSDSNLELTLRTKNDVLDTFYHQGQSHEQSVAEALHGVKSLADGTTQLEPSVLSAKVFGELNPENWDNNNDDVINKQDFATEANYKKLVDYILSGEDLDLSKQVIKNYAASQEQKYHQQGLDKYNQAQTAATNKSGRPGKPANFIIGGQTFNAQDFNNNFVPFVNKLEKMKDGDVEQSPTGLNITRKDGKYYRIGSMSKGKPILDEDQGAMTLQQLGTFDGWGRFFSFEDPNAPSSLMQDVQQVGAYLGMDKGQIAQETGKQNQAQAGAADNL